MSISAVCNRGNSSDGSQKQNNKTNAKTTQKRVESMPSQLSKETISTYDRPLEKEEQAALNQQKLTLDPQITTESSTSPKLDVPIANTSNPSPITSSPTSVSTTTYVAPATAATSDAPRGNTTYLSSVLANPPSPSSMTYVAPTTAQTSEVSDTDNDTPTMKRFTPTIATTTAEGASSTVPTSDDPTGAAPTTNAPSYSFTTTETPTTYTSKIAAPVRSIATDTASNSITSAPVQSMPRDKDSDKAQLSIDFLYSR